MEGGDGDDSISGGRGDDLLNGDEGNDRLAGGPGGDTFYFDGSDGKDTITDFKKGSDDIRIYTTAEVTTEVQVNGDTLIAAGGVDLAVVQHMQELVVTAEADYILIA